MELTLEENNIKIQILFYKKDSVFTIDNTTDSSISLYLIKGKIIVDGVIIMHL